MPTVQSRTYDQILQRMVARVVSRSALSDLNDSSALLQILGATARELDDIHYQLTRISDTWSIDTAVGIDLDERARDIQPGTLARLGPRRATCTSIVFTRPRALGTTITIPAGTQVTTSTNLVMQTTREAVISPSSPEQIAGNGAGRDSTAVPAIAVIAGVAGNVGTGAVTGFVSRPTALASVTNLAAFVGGRDQETDDQFRTRIKAYVDALSRCTVSALEFLVTGVSDPTPGSVKTVQYASVFEDPIDRGNVTVYVDDGAGTAADIVSVTNENVTAGLLGPPLDSAVGGEEFLRLDHWPLNTAVSPVITRTSGSATFTLVDGQDYFLNPANGRLFLVNPLLLGDTISASYSYFVGLIAEVQKVIDGDPADRINYPGSRAAGVRVVVATPVIRDIRVVATIAIAPGYNRTATINNVTNAVNNYINELGISADVIRNEIIEQMMAVPGVVDVTLTTPIGNINILDNELPRSGVNVDID